MGRAGRRLAEEAARLFLRGFAPALTLEATATGVKERVSPGGEAFLPLLRARARAAWEEARRRGKRPRKLVVLLRPEEGTLEVEAFSGPPPEVERWAYPSPLARAAGRAKELMRMADL